MPKISGTVKKSSLEGGFWELHADDGERYQLDGGDERLRTEGARVEVDGKVDKDAFGIGMTGPVLKVKSWKKK
jgi:hypothetical protein